MFKTFSAALLAVSMLAAPALAGGVAPAKPTTPAAATTLAKPDALKARAELVRPHHRLVVRHHVVRHHVVRHHAVRHHTVRHHTVRQHHVHQRMSAHPLHHAAKLSVRPAHTAPRG
jgi:hypothetical protein